MPRAELPGYLEDRRHIVDPLFRALESAGVEFPFSPDPTQANPREILVRGETETRSLFRGYHVPSSGAWGSFGVFFGDCLSPVMLPENGIFYVYRTVDVARSWVSIGSQEYQNLIQQIAISQGLKIDRVSDGVDADHKLSTLHPVYYPLAGTATFHTDLSLEKAFMIIPTGNATDRIRKDLPTSILGKIVT